MSTADMLTVALSVVLAFAIGMLVASVTHEKDARLALRQQCMATHAGMLFTTRE